MKSGTTTFGIWARRVRRWRRWLRHDAWQASLILLLTLSLAEPLVCLLHCRFMMLHAAHAQAGAAHSHHYAPSAPGDAFVSPSEHTQHLHQASQQPGAALVGLVSPETSCPFHDAGAGPLPLSIASEMSPPHEHLSAISLLSLLMLVMPVLFSFLKLASAPPQTLVARQLRPPIDTLA